MNESFPARLVPSVRPRTSAVFPQPRLRNFFPLFLKLNRSPRNERRNRFPSFGSAGPVGIFSFIFLPAALLCRFEDNSFPSQTRTVCAARLPSWPPSGGSRSISVGDPSAIMITHSPTSADNEGFFSWGRRTHCPSSSQTGKSPFSLLFRYHLGPSFSGTKSEMPASESKENTGPIGFLFFLSEIRGRLLPFLHPFNEGARMNFSLAIEMDPKTSVRQTFRRPLPAVSQGFFFAHLFPVIKLFGKVFSP